MKSGISIEVEVMQDRIALAERQRDEACAAAQGFQLAFKEAERLMAEGLSRLERMALEGQRIGDHKNKEMNRRG